MHRLKSQLAGLLGWTRAVGLARKASFSAVILAMAIQAFVVQTHVHLHADLLSFEQTADAQVASFASQSNAIQSSASKNVPVPADEDHCALCQALAVIGNAIAPVAPSLAIPAEISFIVERPLDDHVHVATLSHDWLSRGPPQT